MALELLSLNEDGIPVVSHSQLGTWDRCHFKWHLGYVEKYTSKEKALPLALGSYVHSLLAEYYQRLKDGTGGDHAEALNKLTREKFMSELNMEVISTGLELVRRYVEDFAPMQDMNHLPVEVEKHYMVEFKTPKGRPFILELYVDLITIDKRNSKLWLWEHKTVGGGQFWTDGQVMMDNQTVTYVAALRQLGFDIFGIRFNMLNTYQYKNPPHPDKLFRRINHSRTQQEIDSMVLELGKQVDDLIENAGDTRRSLNKDCSWCWFNEPCLMTMKGFPLEEVMYNYKKKEKREDAEEAASG